MYEIEFAFIGLNVEKFVNKGLNEVAAQSKSVLVCPKLSRLLNN